MSYKSLKQALLDLEKKGELARIREEVSPHLEMAEIQRRVFEAKGPAILFERVRGTRFKAASNIFGTLERARFLFRDTLSKVKKIVQLKADPSQFWRAPMTYAFLPVCGINALPMKVGNGPVLKNTTTIDQLPQILSWPIDGGPFITLPQVYSEDVERPGIMNSNLGMYRIQLSGNEYKTNREIGLHYQIQRGIGIHHAKAIKKGIPLKVSIFVGGPPAHTLSAVLPLPEGLTELVFAGMLSGRRFRYTMREGFVISTDADFCITGTVPSDKILPEGPFGDHLGYYSLMHPFPFLDVQKVYHRDDAIWPFTVVGRPPQEDTVFGKLIHEITAPMVPREIPGVKALHAVDEAGVHPLLLAIGSERYVPYKKRAPKELLTQANAILGFGQCSLAKYLLIAAIEDNPSLDINNARDFFSHILERVNWRRDIHFQTMTTMDTLDYSGTGLNEGSKAVIAAAGEKKRELGRELFSGISLPQGFKNPGIPAPGIFLIQGPEFIGYKEAEKELELLGNYLKNLPRMDDFPLLVIVDDPVFSTESFKNFLWVAFTRSNPSHDIYGIESFMEHRHWGCKCPLIIDARIKPHHAPPLVEAPDVVKRVDRLGAKGGPLHGII